MTPEERVAVEICLGTPYCKPESRDPKDHDNECALRDPELLPKILEQMMCARGEERRAALASAPAHPEAQGAREMNINDSVLVRVTEVGEEVWADHWRNLGLPPHPLPKDADGWSRFQLWELASVFGASMFNGCRVPIETTIRLVDAALATPAQALDDSLLREARAWIDMARARRAGAAPEGSR